MKGRRNVFSCGLFSPEARGGPGVRKIGAGDGWTQGKLRPSARKREVSALSENEAGRIRILALLELMTRLTDEEHPLSAEELGELLREKGISAGRKTIYRDISALREHGTDILFTRRPRAGFFVASRRFEPPEVRLLIDAVRAAPFITEKKTAELTEKLRGLLSEHQARETAGQAHVEARPKFDNEEIYYSIDAVGRAVAQKKKISFLYHHNAVRGNRIVRDEGRRFVISPYALVWDSDRYYVAGNYEKYDDVSVWRLDRIRRAGVTSQDARPFCEVSEYRDFFDAEDYAAKTFHLHHGEKQGVVLRCSGEALDPLLDKFGGELRLSGGDGGCFTVRADVYAGEGLVEWLLQYGDRITVLSPETLREKVAERIWKIGGAYGLTETCAR